MKNIAIIGAAGYTGEELIKILARHPGIHLKSIASRSHAGKSVIDLLPALRHLLDRSFLFSDPESIVQDSSIDLVFLALPHGVAANFAMALIQSGKRVIDLSADFRLNSPERYEAYYHEKHPAPHLLCEAPYVIPELAKPGWESAPLIACPGCYPTSILLPLMPLLQNGILSTEHIVINALSGISGAGKVIGKAGQEDRLSEADKKAIENILFCERAENITAYNLAKHRHLAEIEEQLSLAVGQDIVVQFNPHLAPMKRGIFTTMTVPLGPRILNADHVNGALKAQYCIESLYDVWERSFSGKPFVSILPSGTQPQSAHVVGNNRIDIAAVCDSRTKNFIITSSLDNLQKGASGQAVQIMNLALRLPEKTGLI